MKKIDINQKSIVVIVGLAMAAIFAIAMFLVKPPERSPGYFYFSLFAILCSLAFFGVCWMRTISQSLLGLGAAVSFGYFLCQLIVFPIFLSTLGGGYNPYIPEVWKNRSWSVFLTIHFVVLAIFVIAYFLIDIFNRKETQRASREHIQNLEFDLKCAVASNNAAEAARLRAELVRLKEEQ